MKESSCEKFSQIFVYEILYFENNVIVPADVWKEFQTEQLYENQIILVRTTSRRD